ncbi:MAG: hypothetical protein EBR70_01550 [Verrucomicrobia bacterium]|nr:hypothetical protein [Verrucomicrobiota bacterium]
MSADCTWPIVMSSRPKRRFSRRLAVRMSCERRTMTCPRNASRSQERRSRPSTKMEPEVGSRMPATRSSKVLQPLPWEPPKATRSPGATSKLTSCRISRPPG